MVNWGRAKPEKAKIWQDKNLMLTADKYQT
jgi:hypothetical protein